MINQFVKSNVSLREKIPLDEMLPDRKSGRQSRHFFGWNVGMVFFYSNDFKSSVLSKTWISWVNGRKDLEPFVVVEVFLRSLLRFSLFFFCLSQDGLGFIKQNQGGTYGVASGRVAASCPGDLGSNPLQGFSFPLEKFAQAWGYWTGSRI